MILHSLTRSLAILVACTCARSFCCDHTPEISAELERAKTSWADAEELGQAGARRADRGSKLLLRFTHLLIQAAHVRQELGGEVAPGLPSGAEGLG